MNKHVKKYRDEYIVRRNTRKHTREAERKALRDTFWSLVCSPTGLHIRF